MNDDSIKAGAIIALGENFGKDISPQLAEMWMMLLAPYTAQEVQSAVRRMIETYEYKTMPPFAMLKKFLPDRGPAPALADPEAAKTVKAESEWKWLQDEIRHSGRYHEPKTMHPTTEYVLDSMGGWQAACMWLESEMHYRHDDFVKAWIRDDGNVEIMQLGAAGIEEKQKQIALGLGEERSPKRIGIGAINRLEGRIRK